MKIPKIHNLESFSETEAICSNFISQIATKAKIIANWLVAVILIIALNISFIIKSLEVPKNLNLRITLFLRDTLYTPDFILGSFYSLVMSRFLEAGVLKSRLFIPWRNSHNDKSDIPSSLINIQYYIVLLLISYKCTNV